MKFMTTGYPFGKWQTDVKRALRWMLSLLIISLMILSISGCGSSSASAWKKQYDLGIRYLDEGNYEEAILAFQASIDIDPRQYEGWQGLAETYIAQNDYDMALNALQQGINVTESSELQQMREDVLAQQTEDQKSGAMEYWKSTAPALPGSGLEAWENSRTGAIGDSWAITSASFYIPDGRLFENSYNYFYDDWGRLVKKEYFVDSRHFEHNGGIKRVAYIWKLDQSNERWIEVLQLEYVDGHIEEEVYESNTYVHVAGETPEYELLNAVLSAYFDDFPLGITGTFYFNTNPDNTVFENSLNDYLPGSSVQYTIDENNNVSRVDLYDGEGNLHSYAELTFSKVSVLQ